MSKTSDSTVICASTIFIYLFTIFITFLAEVDLSDITGVKFKVSIGEDGEDLLSDDAASKIFQRYLPLSQILFKIWIENKPYQAVRSFFRSQDKTLSYLDTHLR